MQEYPKISEVIDLIEKAEPTGTPYDRFARGGSQLKNWVLLRTVDYLLTLGYVSIVVYGVYLIIKGLL